MASRGCMRFVSVYIHIYKHERVRWDTFFTGARGSGSKEAPPAIFFESSSSLLPLLFLGGTEGGLADTLTAPPSFCF